MPNKKQLGAITALCSYLHDDEERHWEENDKPKDHIYQSVLIVEKYLKKVIQP